MDSFVLIFEADDNPNVNVAVAHRDYKTGVQSNQSNFIEIESEVFNVNHLTILTNINVIFPSSLIISM